MKLGDRITLKAFCDALGGRVLDVPETVQTRLAAARDVVDRAAGGAEPVYGLNTGLGANLGHRLRPEEITGFQHQLIAGRAVAVGPLLTAQTARAVLLARIIGAAQGHSGISVALFDYLCAVWRSGLAPGVPRHGSIGASDLTQNACWAQALLGQGKIWDGSAWRSDEDALREARLTAPDLQPKDAMALINHSSVSTAVSGLALQAADTTLQMAQHAAVLAFEGFAANPAIFAADVNALRQSPGQSRMAAWFIERIDHSIQPRRIQDALSFRTLAPVFGAARDALDRAIAVWEDELNGASDSPVVFGDAAMCSTPNFHAPALALALEQVSLALAMVGQGAAMRVQRLMDSALTGLPRYLSPVGGASAGFVPLQKTAAALLAEIRRHAQPVIFDPTPVSDGVEDMAPMTFQAARKLDDQVAALELLTAIEAIVAAQARDLRDLDPSPLHVALREVAPALTEDRALGDDVDAAVNVLKNAVRSG